MARATSLDSANEVSEPALLNRNLFERNIFSVLGRGTRRFDTSAATNCGWAATIVYVGCRALLRVRTL